MREIKFRAWNKESKQMKRCGIYPDGVPMAYAGGDSAIALYDRPIMQYTGLKDKNGKEIYEGDMVAENILTCVGIDCPKDSFTIKNHVVELRSPRYWLVDEDMGWEGEGLVSPEDCEIIGNIYENPELLSKE